MILSFSISNPLNPYYFFSFAYRCLFLATVVLYKPLVLLFSPLFFVLFLPISVLMSTLGWRLVLVYEGLSFGDTLLQFQVLYFQAKSYPLNFRRTYVLKNPYELKNAAVHRMWLRYFRFAYGFFVSPVVNIAKFFPWLVVDLRGSSASPLQTEDDYLADRRKFNEWYSCYVEMRLKMPGKGIALPHILLESEASKCEKQLKELGIKDGDWFVCIHAKEECVDWNTHNKNNITNYFETADYIHRLGGHAVRIGLPNLPKLADHAPLIDYATSRLATDEMNIFLFERQRAFIGAQSGAGLCADYFDIPMLLTNSFPWYPYLYKDTDFSVFKLILSSSTGSFVTLEECIKTNLFIDGVGFLLGQEFGGLGPRKFDLLENTSDEILEAFKELMSCAGYANDSWTDTQEGIELQRQWKSIIEQHFNCCLGKMRPSSYFLTKHKNKIFGPGGTTIC